MSWIKQAGLVLTTPLLLSQVLAKVEGSVPLIEIQLELVASEIVWKPELTEAKVSTSIRDMVSEHERLLCISGESHALLN